MYTKIWLLGHQFAKSIEVNFSNLRSFDNMVLYLMNIEVLHNYSLISHANDRKNLEQVWLAIISYMYICSGP